MSSANTWWLLILQPTASGDWRLSLFVIQPLMPPAISTNLVPVQTRFRLNHHEFSLVQCILQKLLTHGICDVPGKE
jgi:hypothetical protein